MLLDPFQGQSPTTGNDWTHDVIAWNLQVPHFQSIIKTPQSVLQDWLAFLLGETLTAPDRGTYYSVEDFDPEQLRELLHPDERPMLGVIVQELESVYSTIWDDLTYAALNFGHEAVFSYDYVLYPYATQFRFTVGLE